MSVSSLRSSPTSSGGPQARHGGEKHARTPRAPAGGEVPCTPFYEWMSVHSTLTATRFVALNAYSIDDGVSVSIARESTCFVRRSTSARGNNTRRPHFSQRRPISAPRRTTCQSYPPQGCGLRKRKRSPKLSCIGAMHSFALASFKFLTV